MKIWRGQDRGHRWVTAVLALLVVAGAGLLVIAIRAQVSAPEAPLTSAAAAAREAKPTTTPSPAATAGRAAAPGPSSTGGTSHPSKRATGSPSPSTSALPALPASEPTRIQVPSIKVDSAVNQVGLNSDGTLEVPAGAAYNQAAWFTGSPTPGQAGPAVIEGHVDGDYGPSVFFKLGALRTGDTIKVTRTDGRTLTFTVYRAERYAKDDFPTAAVYGNTDGPELRLITCGGQVSQQTGHHLDNTVVYAHLTKTS